MRANTLIIGCGALAHELVAVLKASDWAHVDVDCLPAHWHNTPERIVPGVEAKILAARDRYARIVVAYGDCGTGGALDTMLARHDIERLPGDHCYSFFAGAQVFDALAEAEIGTFYLTDYLAANFERLIMRDLGIREHPELRDLYFGHYTRLLHLVQDDGSSDTGPDRVAGLPGDRMADAEAAARALGLPLVTRFTGLAPFSHALRGIAVVAA